MTRGFQPVYTPARRSGPPGWLIGAGVLAIVAVVGLVGFMLLNADRPSASPAPTSVAASSGPDASPVRPTDAGSGEPPSTSTPTDGAPTDASATSAGTSEPPASVDPALAEQIDAVTEQIPPIRELETEDDVPYQFIGRDQFRDELVELSEEDVPPEIRAAEERLLKRLGLLPDDADLDELLVELYGAQVAAYYRPDTGRFYIIERDQPFGGVDKIIVAHEFTHALQDQHFDLEDTRISDPSESDAALAQLAVIEGDATLTSQLWARDNLTPEEMRDMLSDALSGLDEDALVDMPLVLRRQLEFPYTDGFFFVSDVYGLGGYDAVDDALRTPPASTEQILHSRKYYDGEQPVDVALDDVSSELGDGWQLALEQTVGELGIQILAAGGEQPPASFPGLPVEWPHADVAEGWGGDRLNMYENGEQWAIVWETAWDTQADADAFAARMTALQPTFDGATSIAAGDGATVRVVLASEEAVVEAL